MHWKCRAPPDCSFCPPSGGQLRTLIDTHDKHKKSFIYGIFLRFRFVLSLWRLWILHSKFNIKFAQNFQKRKKHANFICGDDWHTHHLIFSFYVNTKLVNCPYTFCGRRWNPRRMRASGSWALASGRIVLVSSHSSSCRTTTQKSL